MIPYRFEFIRVIRFITTPSRYGFTSIIAEGRSNTADDTRSYILFQRPDGNHEKLKLTRARRIVEETRLKVIQMFTMYDLYFYIQ